MRKLVVLAALTALAVGAANAEVHNFLVKLDGSQEVNGGDADGSGLAHLFIDDSTNPPTIDWLIEVQNIALPTTGMHIHQGDRGVNGPVRIDFSNQFSGSDLADADLAGVLSNPTG